MIDPLVRHVPLDAPSFVFFVLVACVAAALTWRRPAWGIATLIVAGPFDCTRYLGGTTITCAKIALLGVAAGLVAGRRDVRALGRPAARTLLVAGLGVLVATALSIVAARERAPVAREIFKAIEYLSIFACTVIAAASDPRERTTTRAIAGTALVVSVLALAQEIVGAPSGLWFGGFPIPRIAGPLEGPNQLAGYLGIALCAVCAEAFRSARPRLAFASLALGSAALVLTISRTGVLAAVLGLGIVIARSREKRARAALVALGAGALAGLCVVAAWGYAVTHSLAGLDLLERFSNLAEAASPGRVGTRSQLWHAALVLWQRHPLVGIGAGNFEDSLGLAGYPQLHTHANSLYLQALAEGGLVLLAATLALVVCSIAVFARGPFREPLVLAAFAASIGFAFHQIFDLLVFYPKVGELWWIVLALAAARVDAAGPSRAAPRP